MVIVCDEAMSHWVVFLQIDSFHIRERSPIKLTLLHSQVL